MNETFDQFVYKQARDIVHLCNAAISSSQTKKDIRVRFGTDIPKQSVDGVIEAYENAGWKVSYDPGSSTTVDNVVYTHGVLTLNSK